jgi:hypothetical protein
VLPMLVPQMHNMSQVSAISILALDVSQLKKEGSLGIPHLKL